jgi:hydrogenase expression/formation protein HypC
MCLGIPMRVVEADEVSALVRGRGESRRVSLLLIGPQPVGTPLLVHIDSAIRVLDEGEVPLIERALDGLEAALEGRPVEAYFSDLIEREPVLPPHLRPGGGTT